MSVLARQPPPNSTDAAEARVATDTRTVPYCHVAIVARFADDVGIETRPWLQRLGLQRTQFEVPDARASAQAYTSLLMAIAEQRDDSAFWLALGQQFSFPAIGELGLLLQACTNGRDALPRLCKFYEILSCGTQLRLHWHDDGDASIELRQSCAPHTVESRLKYELLLGGMARNVELLNSNAKHTPPRYELAYAQPDDLTCHRGVLGSRVSFGHARCRVILGSDFLDQPYALANRTMRALLSKRCDSALDRVVERPQIEALVRRSVLRAPALDLSLAEVASELSLSERTLSRRLRERGFRFEALRRELQYERACELLKSTNLSVAEVGHSLGFENASNFTRAFVRWSGATPTAYRRRLQSACSASRSARVGRRPRGGR
ncbi:MAG: helix-turn-helix domain-containing protein [Nannocystales bacterium]